MASDQFKAAAPDKQFLRVYSLNEKEYDFSSQGTQEIPEGVNIHFPETGNEFYYVIKKDGTGELIAVDPAAMASEFQANIAQLSAGPLEARFLALQNLFEERAELLVNIPSDNNGDFDPRLITIDIMEHSLANLEVARGKVGASAVESDTSMIVPDDQTKLATGKLQTEATILEAMIAEVQAIAPLIKDSTELIKLINNPEISFESEVGMSNEQSYKLNDLILGPNETLEGPKVPVYAAQLN